MLRPAQLTRHVFALRSSQSCAERQTRQPKMTVQCDKDCNRDMHRLDLPNCLQRWGGRVGVAVNIFPGWLPRATEA